jgi:hypothetical protein
MRALRSGRDNDAAAPPRVIYHALCLQAAHLAVGRVLQSLRCNGDISRLRPMLCEAGALESVVDYGELKSRQVNRLHGPPERSNRILRCEIQEGVRPYIRAGVAVILLPMMAIRGQGSYLRDVLEVQAIHRISPGPA